MKRLFPILCLLFSIAFAQQNQQTLPAWLTPAERPLIADYKASRAHSSRSITTPPNFSSLRTMAEWEEIQSLVITWTSFPEIQSEIVRHAKEECEVIIVCSNANQVRSYLANKGIDDTNVLFVEDNFNSIWVRDYGANSVYADDVDSLLLVDWIYNRPRYADDLVPDAVGTAKNLPVYNTTTPPYDLVHTGGNFMADGFGTGFSSKLVIEENGPQGDFNPTNKSEAEIDSVMKWFMGIDRYIKMEMLPYDGIHHIDMHMKLLDEETLLVGEYPQGVADGPQIEANIQYVLANFNSMYGTPYEVIRIPMPPDEFGRYPDNWGDYRTYTNAVFVNKTVLLPIYEEFYDTTALRIWRESLPGYKVVGIDCNDIIPLSGAIHCITKALGVNDPLLISHQPLNDTYDTSNDYPVVAHLQHRTGIQNATLFYTTDTTAGYQTVNMSPIGPLPNDWQANIPAQAAGSEIFYFIGANANSGKQQVRPMPAPSGYWNFKVLGNAAAIEDVFEGTRIKMDNVFPNPASAITCIPVETTAPMQARICLKDIMGREVLEIFQGQLPQGESKHFFRAEDLAEGVYFISLENESQRISQKVLVR